ncbi:MAG: hypothetical protein Q9167_005310 [Letrouitia subvulpina]
MVTIDDKAIAEWLSDVVSTLHSPASPQPLPKQKTSPISSLTGSIISDCKRQRANLLSPTRHIEGLEAIQIAPRTPQTQTSTTTKTSQASKLSPNVQNVRYALANHGMWFEHPAFNQQVELQHLVEEILVVPPGSSMQDKSAEKIRQFQLEHATSNEQSIVEPLAAMVFKTTKTEPTDQEDSDEMLQEAVHSIFHQATAPKSRDFTEDGLARVRDVKFLKDFLPGQDIDCKKLGLSDPKPDLTYGIRPPQYPEPGKGIALLRGEVEAAANVAPGLLYPFLVTEFKSCNSPIEEAENQAIRSGATLVESRRRLNAQVPRIASANAPLTVFGIPSTATTADLSSIAFSVSWVPRFAELHVHWYEERSGQRGIYHMSNIGGYIFSRKEDLEKFRVDIVNILEWGVYKRRSEVERVLKQIYPDF